MLMLMLDCFFAAGDYLGFFEIALASFNLIIELSLLLVGNFLRFDSVNDIFSVF